MISLFRPANVIAIVAIVASTAVTLYSLKRTSDEASAQERRLEQERILSDKRDFAIYSLGAEAVQVFQGSLGLWRCLRHLRTKCKNQMAKR